MDDSGVKSEAAVYDVQENAPDYQLKHVYRRRIHGDTWRERVVNEEGQKETWLEVKGYVLSLYDEEDALGALAFIAREAMSLLQEKPYTPWALSDDLDPLGYPGLKPSPTGVANTGDPSAMTDELDIRLDRGECA
jgi:hypothetical protein